MNAWMIDCLSVNNIILRKCCRSLTFIILYYVLPITYHTYINQQDAVIDVSRWMPDHDMADSFRLIVGEARKKLETNAEIAVKQDDIRMSTHDLGTFSDESFDDDPPVKSDAPSAGPFANFWKRK